MRRTRKAKPKRGRPARLPADRAHVVIGRATMIRLLRYKGVGETWNDAVANVVDLAERVKGGKR